MKKWILLVAGIIVVPILLLFAISDDGYKPGAKERAEAEKINPNGPMKGVIEAMGHIYPPSVDPSKLPDPDGFGAVSYQTYCKRCHGLFNPAMRTPEEWREICPEMFKRLEKLYNTMGMLLLIKLPTSAERNAVVDYLTSHAMKPADSKALPDPDSPGAVLFKGICSHCHTLPAPSFHKAGEWREIVGRMRKNMRLMQKPVISDDIADKIAGYLETHSL